MSLIGVIFMVVSMIISFVLSAILVPLVIALAKKYNWYDEVDPRKMHKGLIPRLGGFALFLSYIIALIIYFLVIPNTHKDDFVAITPFLIGGLIIYLGGVIDDFANLRAKLKFVIQILAALAFTLSPLYFNRFLYWTLPPVLGRIITFFWILSIVNAYNLIDGLDWLCSGLSILTILTMGIIFTFSKSVTADLCFILCGAIAGFMIYNKPPAKIFLGDGGSQTLGYCIATLPLLTPLHRIEDTKALILILLVSIPVTDVIAAIWRRKRDHRKIFSADRAHIHHKLVNIGFSKESTIFFLLTLQVIICVAVISTMFQGRKAAATILVVSIIFVEVFFITIHYINRAVNLKFKGQLDDAPQEEH